MEAVFFQVSSSLHMHMLAWSSVSFVWAVLPFSFVPVRACVAGGLRCLAVVAGWWWSTKDVVRFNESTLEVQVIRQS